MYLQSKIGFFLLDVHCMRQVDISYTLTVVLNAMYPPSSKSSYTAGQTLKSASETRSGSFTSKLSPTVSKSVYQISFLGKI